MMGVFVSSISDIDENKIEETKIDTPENSGLETIHLLLLVLFFVLFIRVVCYCIKEESQRKKSDTEKFY